MEGDRSKEPIRGRLGSVPPVDPELKKLLPKKDPERVETVNHPAHYGGDAPHEVKKCLKAWGLKESAYLWTAAKYLGRDAGKKTIAIKGVNPNADIQAREVIVTRIDDLKKAVWYIQEEIRDLEEKL